MVLTIYHYLNVCYYGGQMLNKKKTLVRIHFIPYKLRLLHFVQMLQILIMNKNVPLHPNSSYYQMCISKIHFSDIIIIIYMR